MKPLHKQEILTVERLRQLFAYDVSTGLFTRLVRTSNSVHVGDVAGTKNVHGYWQINIDYKLYLAHRLAWLYVYGEWPAHKLDHINGDRQDNRIANLRGATDEVNAQNIRRAQKNNSTGLLGAFARSRGKTFISRIRVNNKYLNLGSFQTKEAAHAAYVEAKRKYHAGCTI